MFKSQKRPIVVPQSEHARMAGILASLWGNELFDRPAMDFQSFIKGVTFHDRGYSQLDYDAIGEVAPERWLAIQRQGISQDAGDAAANAVALLHMKRLVDRSGSEAPYDELVALAEQRIADSVARTSLPRAAFEWADKITNWCDDVAFDFSMETRFHQAGSVCTRVDSADTVTIEYDLRPEGVIAVRPWPFSVESYSGFIIGYEIEGYPERLEPVLMPFTLTPWEE
ncbi:MAG: DUF3891 family protein [Anaerolineae bacterium]|nr:DUF3891 family protein [Anaerolineae bacterium]